MDIKDLDMIIFNAVLRRDSDGLFFMDISPATYKNAIFCYEELIRRCLSFSTTIRDEELKGFPVVRSNISDTLHNPKFLYIKTPERFYFNENYQYYSLKAVCVYGY